ncbi:hypothetical protein [Sporofaciens musculi]|uniref:hypothetical protein n=2 Tax=Sporofaciens musculi TaxID=2681861 RepID=UPI00258CCBC9|nr:hypothetical protein [Sporofaciens musculi]
MQMKYPLRRRMGARVEWWKMKLPYWIFRAVQLTCVYYEKFSLVYITKKYHENIRKI